VKYQFGVMVNDSYLERGHQSKMNYAVTGGLVFPMRNVNTLHFNIEYGKNGFTGRNRNAVREDFLKITFGFSFKEAWFIKYRYD
ncbi:MAG: hypothetical protein LUD68_08770, partial [Rikenellaceae bacterium]|nr:hypothetical protein [Rikenellaceae bacterium]